MYSYSDEERAAYSAEAFKKTDGHGDLFEAAFVPDGAEDDEGISVLWRRFTPAEVSAWVDRPTTATETSNTAMDIVLAVDGADGKSIPGAVRRLADLMDGALETILNRAAEPLGLHGYSKITSMTLGRKTALLDFERFGLAISAGDLREKYPDPGQLRIVQVADMPAIIVRRPTKEEWAKRCSGKTFAASRDLLLSCTVLPALIEERRQLIERWPALGATLTPVFQEMRGRGATIEGKGVRQDSPLPRT